MKIPIERETIIGLRDAYLALELEKMNPGFLMDRLDSWIEQVLLEAGELEFVRARVQADWIARRRR